MQHHRFKVSPATSGLSVPNHGAFQAAADGTFVLPADGALIQTLASYGFAAELVEEDVPAPPPPPAPGEGLQEKLEASEMRVRKLEEELSEAALRRVAHEAEAEELKLRVASAENRVLELEEAAKAAPATAPKRKH